MDKTKILIVEDDDEVRAQMKWALASEYEVLVAEDRMTALRHVERERPAVVTLDLGLPPTSGDSREGFATLSELLHFDPLIKVIIITGQNEKKNAVEAISQGAHDFLCKPVNIDELKIILSRAVYICELEHDHREASRNVPLDSFEGIIGASPQVQAVFGTVRKIATTDAPVLIVGESGTGKEMAATAIHRLSARNAGPFVAINCGAIPENLLESELFGHEKGSFTGAHAQRVGRIECAQRGTLFLDEIGELSPALQVKLLRFLQERQIERVGGRSLIPVDVRVIAATNVDLTKAMADGRFREDLYYRLAVVVLSMPPLRERQGDIILLATALLHRHALAQGKTLAFTQKALKVMESHSWPGNVRELENRIQRAAIMAENGRVTPEDLEITSGFAEYEGKGLGKARQQLERHMIESALARNHGNLTRTALELEISRPTLYELMEKLSISRKSA